MPTPETTPWVALVGPEIEENLGLRYLASALGGAGIASAVLPFNEPRELAGLRDSILAADEPPLVVALSLAFQWRALDVLALAVSLREGGYAGHVTAGGHFAQFCRRELLTDFEELDSICRHEAEEVLVDLVRAVRHGGELAQVPGLTVRSGDDVIDGPRRSPPELAALSWPDRRGEPATCLGHPIASLVAGRGCYARCAFCCIAAWHREGGGPRFRLRAAQDVADEMAWLHFEHGAEIFIFHDDNFFLPEPGRSLERVHALADGLDAHGVGRIATVVKARPPDVSRELFGAMKERLGLVRLFLGVESDTDQGLDTLERHVSRDENHAAMALLQELELYVCFNLLLFDPDTTVAGLEANLAFLERWSHNPANFGRVELYAGTPLLSRMSEAGRCRGDYLGWDYTLATPRVQHIYELAMRCFRPRNFGGDALANRLQGTRFDVAVCRRFHPDRYRPEWLARAQELSRRLATSSVACLREIVGFSAGGRDARADDRLADERVAEWSARLRRQEREIAGEATRLEQELQEAAGARCRHWRPLPSTLEIRVSRPRGSGGVA